MYDSLMEIAKIKKILVDIGFTAHESAAYIALLQIGKGSADSVASRAEIKRSTAYLSLESLFRQGLIGKIPRKRKLLFLKGDPNDLVRLQEERLRSVDSVVPFLRSLGAEADSFGTQMFEGIEGIKSAYEFRSETLRDTEFVAFFGYVEGIDLGLEKFLIDWGLDNMRKNIKSRVIVPEHPSLAIFRAQDLRVGREVKILSESTYPSNISIEIYDSFVRVVLFKEKVALIIESKALCVALKSIFEMVW